MMSEVFYRKWRPRRLDQVVGQEPITQTLGRAVALGRVAHAYLFCGPRGTGKTSTARILAKAVNCLSPEQGEPDNDCEICRSINEGRALDLIEIDAASNRGIDDIRNLSDKIRFAPNEARYKVYIIDEVHMLTEPAFNALLKTLEEPPAHAIFVLATTEAHKVPLTVISRCQRFDFRRIPVELIVDKLGDLCREEGIEASTDALALIARRAGGSLRDAENLLEQVVVSYSSPIAEEQVRDLLQLGGDEMALELVGHIVKGAVRDGLAVINKVAQQGSDLRQLHRGVMEHLREVLLLKTGAGASRRYPEDVTSQLGSLAGEVSMDRLVHILKSFATVDLRHDSSSPLPLELALVESTAGPPATAATPDRPAEAARESRPAYSAGGSPAPPRPRARVERDAPPSRSVAPATRREVGNNTAGDPPAGTDAGLDGQVKEIARGLRHIGKKYKLGALLNGSRACELSDGAILVRFPYASHIERMEEELNDPEVRRSVAEVVSKVMDGPYDLRPTLMAGSTNGPRQSAAQRSPLVRAAQALGARVVSEKEEAHDE